MPVSSVGKRCLAIAVSNKRLGYCISETPQSLLDWGVTDLKDRKPEIIEKALTHIFNFYTPEYLVLEDVQHPNCRLSKANKEVLILIEKMAKNRNILTTHHTWLEAKEKLGLKATDNFDSMARTVCEIIPTLLSQLPPERKIWQGEHRAMPLFKAVTLLFCH